MISRRRLLGELAAAGTTLLLGDGCSSSSDTRRTARPDFYWGVGIENTWMVQADPSRDGDRRPLDEYALTQHYERWQDDLALAADLGVTALRISLPWPRAEPEPGRYDFSWLEGPIELLSALGIVPIVDLIHYGTPAWMADGIGDPAFPATLAVYAAEIAEHFGEALTHYTPCNEPQVAALRCGSSGAWPPYGTSTARWAELGARIARAMVLATRSLRETSSEVVIVSAEAPRFTLVDTLFPDAAPELAAAVATYPACVAYGKVGPEHPLVPLLDSLGVDAKELGWLRDNAAPPDLLGYNHYPDILDYADAPDFARDGSLPLAQAAREATDRVELGLRRAHDYFGLPVYLTETSAGLTGPRRAAYATALGELVARLRADDFPIVGVNWWPLFQAVQWEYRDQPERPLEDFLVAGGWNNGLYDLLPGADGALERVPTEAVPAFREIVGRGG